LHDLLNIPRSQQEVPHIYVEMPKFNFEVGLEVSDHLSRMGMPDAFNENKADFSGMTGRQNLSISKIAQKNFINVNEKGTEAASASYTGFVDVAAPIAIWIRIDRPFLFLILDRPTGALLFMGRMEDPR
jgi:serpin B